MHSAPILAPRPTSDRLQRAQWERTIAGYIVDAIEPLAMFSLIGLAFWCWPRGDGRGFLTFASIALALMAARRLDKALVSWTDMLDLPTYSLLAKFMWMPAVAAWAPAWNRWRQRPWKSIDASAFAIMVAQIVGALTHSASVTSVSTKLGRLSRASCISFGTLARRSQKRAGAHFRASCDELFDRRLELASHR